ncbi:hypothetical protein [Oceanobacillus sp. Castelsardo]|uniref:hypothetical protein n=1 Tax=Oceanobacillus sp. Castelsardo TaxID=1851204 RepID=UPI00083869E3|nr:hypothetical protein [Oceanobacillus sp. Castelsardo]
MTTQVVIMNTGGIALATDSAVSMKGKKVSDAADKLFPLSERHNIGVMTYGVNAMFHIPWEALIKVYNRKLDVRGFDTVKEYMEDFLKFLHQNEFYEFMDEENEERHINHTLSSNMTRLHHELSQKHKRLYRELGKEKQPNEVQEMYMEQAELYLSKRRRELTDKEYPKGFNSNDYVQLVGKYAGNVSELLEQKFERHLFKDEWMDAITEVMIQSIIKDFSDKFSGIIFAGYGKKEIYPTVYLLIIDGKVNHKNKYFIKKKKINHQIHGIIFPLAKRDRVKGFLDGIHADIEDFIGTIFKNQLAMLTDTWAEQVKDHLHDEADWEEIQGKMSAASMQVYDTYKKELFYYQREKFIDPMLEVVESSSTIELAHLAESLLQISTLKRDFSAYSEMVGGPIDVATITKGDGFSWLRKKEGGKTYSGI